MIFNSLYLFEWQKRTDSTTAERNIQRNFHLKESAYYLEQDERMLQIQLKNFNLKRKFQVYEYLVIYGKNIVMFSWRSKKMNKLKLSAYQLSTSS